MSAGRHTSCAFGLLSSLLLRLFPFFLNIFNAVQPEMQSNRKCSPTGNAVQPEMQSNRKCSPTGNAVQPEIGTLIYFSSAMVYLNRQLFLRPLSHCRISCTYLVNVEKKTCLVLLSQMGRRRVSCTYLVMGEISDFLSWSRKTQGV